MFHGERIGSFIVSRRKELGMTQQQLADKLHVSFQAVSKWENGTTYPNVEILYELAIVLDVTTDEILVGGKKKQMDYPIAKLVWISHTPIR